MSDTGKIHVMIDDEIQFAIDELAFTNALVYKRANQKYADLLARLKNAEQALDEAKLIIQCAETANKRERAIGETWSAWGPFCPFQKRIDAFLDKHGRFPTEAK